MECCTLPSNTVTDQSINYRKTLTTNQSLPIMESNSSCHFNMYNAKWKNIEIDNTDYIVAVSKVKETWKVTLSNLVEIWSEVLTKDEVLQRCQALNPLLDVDSFDVKHTVKEMLTDIPKYAVDISVNQIKLQTVLEGFMFKFSVKLAKGSPQQFWNEVTKPLCESSRELQRRYDILLNLVRRKDEEITEYKMGGAELTRKNIETVSFHEDLLKEEISTDSIPNCITTFQAMLDLYSDMKTYETTVKEENQTQIQNSSRVDPTEPMARIKEEYPMLDDLEQVIEAVEPKIEITTVENNPTLKLECESSLHSDTGSDQESARSRTTNCSQTSAERPVKRSKRTVLRCHYTDPKNTTYEQGVAYFCVPNGPGKEDVGNQNSGWTTEQMKAAMIATQYGKSLREVSRTFGVPLTTLRDRIKAGECYEARMGRRSIFTKEQEADLVTHLMALSRIFYRLSTTELRRIVYEYAEQKRLPHTFNREARLAGKDWMYSFVERHPDLSFRRTEPSPASRVSNFCKTEVERFYADLAASYQDHKFSSSKIFDVYESELTTVSTSERNVTLCCCMNASGFFVPPMFIFAHQRIAPAPEREGPPGSVYTYSKNGLMTEELFQKWLLHFVKHTHASVLNPVLLIVDNRSNHTSLFVYSYCRSRGITIVSLPPHTSHRLHPLGLAFFGPLRTAYRAECNVFVKSHQTQRITSCDVPALVAKAYNRIATLDVALEGFENTGIFPLNREAFESISPEPSNDTWESPVVDEREALSLFEMGQPGMSGLST